MNRPNLEQDYIFDRSRGDYLHHKTKNSYDADLEAYVDYLERRVKNCSIPDVVGRSEQLKAEYKRGYEDAMDSIDRYEYRASYDD